MTKPVCIEESWKKHLASEFEQTCFTQPRELIRSEYEARAIYPPAARIFRAFDGSSAWTRCGR